LRLAHTAGGELQVGFTDNQGVFSADGTVITTRLVDAQYPEYEAIIPKEFTISVRVAKNDFASALKAVAVFAKGANGVAVRYGQDAGLMLSARSQDAGEGEVEVAAEVVGGTDTILFNHKYLLDMFQYLESEDVIWKLNGPTTPVVFQGAKDTHYIYLVMPIKA
jgi:DNA polymerase-3 subunit beta